MAGKLKLEGKLAKIAEKMLKDVCDILEDEKIDYVLEAGTLLGIVRENRLLPWDNDLDVTITNNFAEKLISIRWKFWLKGYRTRIRKFKKETGPFKKGEYRILKIQTRIFFFFKGVSLMDIFIKHLIDDKYFWIVSDRKPVLKSTPRHFYDERTTYEFRDKNFMVPKDYIGYLEYHYGDWKTPKKDWNFRTDDTCEKVILD